MATYTQDTCPDRHLHTPAPRGYLEWHDWAHRMSRKHKVGRCPTCGLWAIWVPKRPQATK